MLGAKYGCLTNGTPQSFRVRFLTLTLQPPYLVLLGLVLTICGGLCRCVYSIWSLSWKTLKLWKIGWPDENWRVYIFPFLHRRAQHRLESQVLFSSWKFSVLQAVQKIWGFSSLNLTTRGSIRNIFKHKTDIYSKKGLDILNPTTILEGTITQDTKVSNHHELWVVK